MLLLLLAGPPAGWAAPVADFSPTIQRAYFEVQKLRLEPARRLLAEEHGTNPNNAALAYLENYADMYYLLISEDRAAYARLSGQEDVRLRMLRELPDRSPYQRLLRAEVRLHWAFVKLKFGDELSACWDIIKAYRLLDENRRQFPTFLPTLKSLGLLHVLIGSVPEQFAWVPRTLGMDGDVAGGLRELKLVQQKDPFFRQEAQLIYLLLHAFTLELSEAQLRELKSMPARQPDNLLFHFFTTSVLMKQGRSEEASAVLAKAPRSGSYVSFPFLDYMRGELLLQKGNYELAYRSYDRFQRDFKGFNFLKDSYYKQFLCLWLTGRDREAAPLIARVNQVGQRITESDKYAASFAENYRNRGVRDGQKALFKARYSSDGGYFGEALAALRGLEEESFQTKEDRAEFNYRYGRILHKMGDETAALPYYQRAITLSESTYLYFGPSAALQAGYIYKSRNNRSQAVAHFKKAMAYKRHEYKNSIDNKARAALSELGA